MKKTLLTLLLLLIFQCSCHCENIVSYVVIDGSDEREIEVFMNKDQMYVPCKYILNFFEIPFKENHAEKSLSFKNSVIKNSTLFIDGKKQSCPVYFVKNGMTGIANEYFLSADVLSNILEKNISTDASQLLVSIKTKSDAELAVKTYENPFLVVDPTVKPKAYDEITLPVQKGKISLDSIAFSENMVSDAYSQIYIASQSKNCAMNNNMQMSLTGKLGTGDYKVDMGTNSYSNNFFSFSGLSPQYRNKYKDLDYIIGKVDAWDFGGGTINTEIMGAQVKDHVEKALDYKSLDGHVEQTSIVKVYINDDFEKEISTYGGYYSLKDVMYGKKVEKIKIDEILADGSVKEIFSKRYKDADFKKNVPKRDFIAGVSGLQNRLWANYGYIYQTITKKFVLGYKTKKQINDKLTFENFLTADKIFAGDTNNNWGLSLLSNKKYLNFSTIRNPNALEGATYVGVLTYKNNEAMNSKLYFGGSASIANDGITEAGPGFYLKYDNNYIVNKDTTLTGSVFAIAPAFYMAGSSSGNCGFVSDRLGASITGNTSYKNVSFSGTYSKYKSNFGNYYQGGLIDFDEYNFVARAHFLKLPSMSLKINNRHGLNEMGEITSNSYEFSADKKLRCFNLNAGVRKNLYANNYTSNGYSGYSSEYSDIFTTVGFPLGRKFGNLVLGHDIVDTISDSSTNNYSAITINYTTPPIKGYNVNLSTGLHYAGNNKGNDMGFGLTKRLKSGSTVSLNYRYSQTPFYMIDNMYLPSSMRHSITMDFSELYGIGSRGPQAIGSGNENKGYLEVRAFLDVNQNGIKDRGEPSIDNVPIKVENDSEILVTGKSGLTKLKAEDVGVHNVKIFEDELPTLLSCHNKTKPSRFIKIDRNSKTDVEFGLISSVGNINGTVSIKDEFNNSLRFDDVVVSILDTTGKEVNYTNLNEDGTFSFSGLTPGKYIISIDQQLQDLYNIKPDAASENYTVEIPPVYKDFITIDNVNLAYKSQI